VQAAHLDGAAIFRRMGTQIQRVAGQEWVLSGDPTEGALLCLGMKAGFGDIDELEDELERLDTVPFDSAWKFAATMHDLPAPAHAPSAQGLAAWAKELDRRDRGLQPHRHRRHRGAGSGGQGGGAAGDATATGTAPDEATVLVAPSPAPGEIAADTSPGVDHASPEGAAAAGASAAGHVAGVSAGALSPPLAAAAASSAAAGAGKRRVMLVKGAPEVLVPRCAFQSGITKPLPQQQQQQDRAQARTGATAAGGSAGGDAEEASLAAEDFWSPQPIDRDHWLRAAEAYSREGLRVLVLCHGILPDAQQTVATSDVLVGPPRLQLDAMVGILDPPRDEVAPAIEECRHASIAVCMITGDHPATAGAIARLVGIDAREVLTGQQLQAMSDEELQRRVLSCRLYARASPEHKLRIVQALQATGAVVSMTGDGVNDAPALKRADIGVAMGITGTDVAKEASKMILADDCFATIVTAVREGRTVYVNLQKILLFVLPSSAAQGLVLLAALVINMPSPLTPIMILYVNLLTAITLGLVLALEKPEPGVMDVPPRRPGKRLLGSLLTWRSCVVTLLFIVAMLGNMQWQLASGGSVAEGRTVAMTQLVMLQCLYVCNCKYTYSTSIRLSTLTSSHWLTAMVLLNAALQCLVIYTPGVQDIFETAAIDGIAWLRILLLALAVFLYVEFEKTIGRTRVWHPLRDACRRRGYCLATVEKQRRAAARAAQQQQQQLLLGGSAGGAASSNTAVAAAAPGSSVTVVMVPALPSGTRAVSSGHTLLQPDARCPVPLPAGSGNAGADNVGDTAAALETTSVPIHIAE
jgi:magnesium-transporting ATPase (P-type)